jgi:nitrate reductase NapE component
MEYAKKGGISIFIVGLLTMGILSLLGLVYLSKMAYEDKKIDGDKYAGGLSQPERNIARFAVIVLWIQIAWAFVGGYIQGIWMGKKLIV